MATFQAVILKGKVHVRMDGTSNIKIRITHRGKPDYISTPLHVNPKKFKNGQATGGNDTAIFINNQIRVLLKIYSDRFLLLGSTVERLTVKELKDYLITGSDPGKIDFHKFAATYHDKLLAKGKTGSARGLTGVIARIKEFKNPLSFAEIDGRFLADFAAWLKEQGLKNGVDNYMRELRLIYKKAMDQFNDEDKGLTRIPHYPFKKYKFEKLQRDTSGNSLKVHQVKMLLEYQPKTSREELGRDVFYIMLAMIGINSKDLYFIKKPVNGRVIYKRAKTGREFSIKVEPELIPYLEKYKGTGSRLFKFAELYVDYLHFQKAANIGLKSICTRMHKAHEEEEKKRGIQPTPLDFPEVITTNWSRHTWGTIGRVDCRIPKDDIALAMGHIDQENRVTDIYINYGHSISDEANRRVLDKLKGDINPADTADHNTELK